MISNIVIGYHMLKARLWKRYVTRNRKSAYTIQDKMLFNAENKHNCKPITQKEIDEALSEFIKDGGTINTEKETINYDKKFNFKVCPKSKSDILIRKHENNPNKNTKTRQ